MKATATVPEVRFSRRDCMKIASLGFGAWAATHGLTALGEQDPPAASNKGRIRPDLRFVLIPKVVHPWFDEVHKGAVREADLLTQQLSRSVRVNYLPPSSANLSEQNTILEKAIASRPTGIAIDPLEAVSRMPLIRQAIDRGIPLLVFDSPSPEPDITSVGNDFTEQGMIAAERLVALVEERGKVAIMQGVRAAPNHKERYDAQIRVLRKYSAITIVDGGTDNDDINTARQQAAAVLAAHADLRGYLCCDAAGPVGIAAAIKGAGKIGQIKVVGMDGIKPILEAVKEGIIESSSSTIPQMQGLMAVLILWQASLGIPIPRRIDTGINIITRDNVDSFLTTA